MCSRLVGRGFSLSLFATASLLLIATLYARSKPAPLKTFAQKLVEETMSAHSELSDFEISALSPEFEKCITIASTEPKGVGEQCDKDELTAMKTNRPFVEKEKENGKEVYDVTIPLHDPKGRIIATAGITFKPLPDQRQEDIVAQSQKIVRELETRIQSRQQLFEVVKRAF